MKELLRNLISFKTIPGNTDEIRKCFDFIENYLVDSKLIIKRFIYNNVESMVISNTNGTNLDIIFSGHIDVVPADDSLFNLIEKDDSLYGRGTFDMKGSAAVMIEVMKNLNTNNKVALMLTSDEEIGGFNGTKMLLEDAGYTGKIAIVPDAGKNFDLIIQEKGVLQLKLSISGTSAHSALLWEGDNAIEKLLSIYNKIIGKYPKSEDSEFKTTVNLAKISGGDALNKVADKATIEIDIRHIPNDTKESILTFIKNLDPNLSVETIAQGECFNTNPDNTYIQKYLSTCKQTLNQDINITFAHVAGDARFFSNEKIPTVLMNPVGDNYHKNDEYVSYSSLKQLYNIYSDFIQSN